MTPCLTCRSANEHYKAHGVLPPDLVERMAEHEQAKATASAKLAKPKRRRKPKKGNDDNG